MTAKVLVVDDILANVRLLEAKLTTEYFEVITAVMNGIDAIDAVIRRQPDIVLLDIMMPGMDGIEVCQRLKSNPDTHHIPIIMVTALDQPDDRIRGLEAGADDFLTKPVNDMALFCRLKSLVRLKMLVDELRARSSQSDALGLVSDSMVNAGAEASAKILVVDNRGIMGERIRAGLSSLHSVEVLTDPARTVATAEAGEHELIIISMDLVDHDGLRLCSQLRSIEKTRQVPILIVVDPDDSQRLIRALDMGVNDYLMRPIDRQELVARVNTQIKRWRYAQRLRANVTHSLQMAVTTPLTGLYNRRHMDNQLNILVDNAATRGRPLVVLAIDVDYFKAINDVHGHDVGDRVLQELAARMRKAVRNVDLCCRAGGEEFILILPDTDIQVGYKVAERLRRSICGRPFNAGARNGPLDVTVSIGVAGFEKVTDTREDILKRADEALYKAKRTGRNRVVADAA